MNCRLFGNGLPTLLILTGGSNRFFKPIADVFPPCHHVNTHLNAPDKKTAKRLLS